MTQTMQSPDFLVTHNERLHSVIISWRVDLPRPSPMGLPIRWLSDDKWSLPALRALDLLEYFKSYHPDKRVSFSKEAAELIYRQVERETATAELAIAEDGNVPEVLSVTMKNFQRAALAYILRDKPRKIVTLDTGLGKTAVAVAYSEIRQVRTLYVTKAGLTLNLRNEIRKLVNQEAIILKGTVPNIHDMRLLQDPKHKHFIISYDSLSRDLAIDKKTNTAIGSLWASLLVSIGNFDLLVVDEAHNIRNRGTKRYKALGELAAIPSILFLTATPLVNVGTDLFSLLHILDTGRFGSETEFIRAYLSYDGKRILDPKRLNNDLLPYMFRRRKQDVIKDLPPKIRHTHTIALEGKWEQKYNDVLNGIYTSYDDSYIVEVPPVILAQINRFRQVVSQAKVEHTIELARTLEESGEKCLIFTSWKETAEAIANDLFCEYVHGDVSNEDRQRIQDKFNNDPNIKHLVLTIKTGQEGFNLTGASAVIFNDYSWLPTDHKQAEDRCWGRLNDLHGALVYYVAVDNSIDNEMMKILQRKQEMIDKGVEGQREFAEAKTSMVKDFMRLLGKAKHK